jgi:two-component system OmpR family sensor kinase
VFERFVRGHRARAHRADGSGIGLSIAQAIVKAHRGHIDIRSAPEEGTEVRVVLARLPIHETEASVQQP